MKLHVPRALWLSAACKTLSLSKQLSQHTAAFMLNPKLLITSISFLSWEIVHIYFRLQSYANWQTLLNSGVLAASYCSCAFKWRGHADTQWRRGPCCWRAVKMSQWSYKNIRLAWKLNCTHEYFTTVAICSQLGGYKPKNHISRLQQRWIMGGVLPQLVQLNALFILRRENRKEVV